MTMPSDRAMLEFRVPEGRFQYRVAGVLLHDGRVLLQHDPKGFWYLPGGRVEFAERSTAALEREFAEELHCRVHCERVLWFVENFFDYDGRCYHEVGIYYLVSARDGVPDPLEPPRTREGDRTLVNRWHELDLLQTLPILPAFLSDALRALPDTPQFVVQRG